MTSSNETTAQDTRFFWLLALAIVLLLALGTILFGLPGLAMAAMVMVIVIWAVLIIISQG